MIFIFIFIPFLHLCTTVIKLNYVDFIIDCLKILKRVWLIPIRIRFFNEFIKLLKNLANDHGL